MTYFEDLTPYSYILTGEEAEETVNIGWLDHRHSFSTGETSEEFRVKLAQLCRHRVQQTRGPHGCEFCKSMNDSPWGSSEIRVPGKSRTYAAPELVLHYVTEHNYLPPEEFISAVLEWHELVA